MRRELAATIVGRGWGLLELRPMRMSLEDIFLSLTTEDAASAAPEPAAEADSPLRLPTKRGGRQCVTSLPSPAKSCARYFASPIAYIVIGFFALLFGYFFYALLSFFERQSMQMSMQHGRRDEHQPDAHRRRC